MFPPHPRSIDGRQVVGDNATEKNPRKVTITEKNPQKVTITDKIPQKVTTPDKNAQKVTITDKKSAKVPRVKAKMQPTIAAMMSLCRRNSKPFTCVKCGFHNHSPRGECVVRVRMWVRVRVRVRVLVLVLVLVRVRVKVRVAVYRLGTRICSMRVQQHSVNWGNVCNGGNIWNGEMDIIYVMCAMSHMSRLTRHVRCICYICYMCYTFYMCVILMLYVLCVCYMLYYSYQDRRGARCVARRGKTCQPIGAGED